MAMRTQHARPGAFDALDPILAATSDDTAAETRAYAIVMVLFTMGLRVSELCGLNIEETNLARGQAWILGKIRRYLRHRISAVRGPLVLTRGNRGKNRDGRSRRAQSCGSSHRGINSLLAYIHDRDRNRNQRSLADVVAATVQR
jgi:integrase